MKESYKSSDYFIGEISPFLLFEMEFHSLFYVVQNHKNDVYYTEINPSSQVAFIGLFGYFEAFCKHQFAAIANIFPSLIKDFAFRRNEPTIEFSTIVSLNEKFNRNIGFLLAEKYDFGTAKAINGLFRDLVGISPFSTIDEKRFNDVATKRNLLVHHGGYYTLKYLKKFFSEEFKQTAFKHALKIDTAEYEEISDFLFEMAVKITKQSVKTLKSKAEFKSLSQMDVRIKAVEELLKGIYDTLE
ncbi:MAG: hypothetical protein H6577_09935 [Lewinellaceae bacterium]|nr:hypothetical protein [Saprospiraceae bacterium]MCB9338436.1 hypothetical protein [Lewinellaceae bacterium]